MWSPLSWDPASPPRKLVSSKAILNLWTGNLKELAWNITRSGTNDVVTSAGWYLPAGGSYAVDPSSYCETDPSKPFYCTPEQRSRIIGGEACMWCVPSSLSILELKRSGQDMTVAPICTAGEKAPTSAIFSRTYGRSFPKYQRSFGQARRLAVALTCSMAVSVGCGSIAAV